MKSRNVENYELKIKETYLENINMITCVSFLSSIIERFQNRQCNYLAFANNSK